MTAVDPAGPAAHDEVSWDDLVAHATLGTGRRPDVPSGCVAGHPVPTAPGREGQLLDAAAMAWAARRASRTAPAVDAIDPRWDGPVAEDRPVAPSEAVALLDVLLHGGLVSGAVRSRLIARWVRATALGGRRLPTRAVPDVLDALPARRGRDDGLTAVDQAALGTRGRWLITRNPAWSSRLRSDDPAPHGSPEAPHAAARRARMGRRLASILSVQQADGRPRPALDDAARPDAQGLADATEPPPTTGVVTWWHRQVLVAAPHAAWVDLAGSPAAAVALQTGDPVILLHVATAAAEQRDAGWCRQLLPAVLARHAAIDPPAGGRPTPVEWSRWVAVLVDLLEVLPAPWDDALVDAVTGWALAHPSPAMALDGVGSLALDRAGPALDRQLAVDPLAATAHLPTAEADAVARVLQRLRTVRSLQRAITDTAAPAPPTSQPPTSQPPADDHPPEP